MPAQEIPQEWVDEADRRVQDQILTSADEERYADGDMAEEIYELAQELWDAANAECRTPETPMMTRNGPIIPWPY